MNPPTEVMFWSPHGRSRQRSAIAQTRSARIQSGGVVFTCPPVSGPYRWPHYLRAPRSAQTPAARAIRPGFPLFPSWNSRRTRGRQDPVTHRARRCGRIRPERWSGLPSRGGRRATGIQPDGRTGGPTAVDPGGRECSATRSGSTSAGPVHAPGPHHSPLGAATRREAAAGPAHTSATVHARNGVSGGRGSADALPAAAPARTTERPEILSPDRPVSGSNRTMTSRCCHYPGPLAVSSRLIHSEEGLPRSASDSYSSSRPRHGW